MWDWYDYPEGHPALKAPGESFTWAQILSERDAILYDFQRLLGVDLTREWTSRSWRWFTAQVSGLLSTPDSLLFNVLRKPSGGS